MIFPGFLKETLNYLGHNLLPAGPQISGSDERECFISVSLSTEIENAFRENASLLAGAYGFSLRLFVGPVAL